MNLPAFPAFFKTFRKRSHGNKRISIMNETLVLALRVPLTTVTEVALRVPASPRGVQMWGQRTTKYLYVHTRSPAVDGLNTKCIRMQFKKQTGMEYISMNVPFRSQLGNENLNPSPELQPVCPGAQGRNPLEDFWVQHPEPNSLFPVIIPLATNLDVVALPSFWLVRPNISESPDASSFLSQPSTSESLLRPT